MEEEALMKDGLALELEEQALWKEEQALRENKALREENSLQEEEKALLEEAKVLEEWTQILQGKDSKHAMPAMREAWVRPLSWEDPLEKGKATHSSILA